MVFIMWLFCQVFCTCIGSIYLFKLPEIDQLCVRESCANFTWLRRRFPVQQCERLRVCVKDFLSLGRCRVGSIFNLFAPRFDRVAQLSLYRLFNMFSVDAFRTR